MLNKQKGPNILFFAIFTTITIFVWIGAEAYHILHKKTLENVPSSVLTPLSPVLDTSVLKNIEEKVYFPDTQSKSTTNPEASSSAQISPAQLSTSSAQPASP